MQSTKHILLVRPANFGYNTETAASNAFQQMPSTTRENLIASARQEFEAAIKTISASGITTVVADDTPAPLKTDAVFPNNWVSFHEDGKVILYPMEAEGRRWERRMDIIESLGEDYHVSEIIDLSFFENENKFLEGTGSVVFDHDNRIAYAALSSRTHKDVLLHLCRLISYKPVYFTAVDENSKPIYHTNVMMCLAEKFAVICLESIADDGEKNTVIQSLINAGHCIVDISLAQVRSFAGNMLAVLDKMGNTKLVMSRTAYNSLEQSQKSSLEKFAELIPLSIPCIEAAGGGSARCMIAEIFLPVK